MIDTVLFDLDGTLTDSAPGITKSVAYALKKYGIEADPVDLKAFVGPPLAESFARWYGLTNSMEAIRFYREYYEEKGMLDNEVYPGVMDMLAGLKNQGMKIILCTSKPEDYARQILAHFQMAPYFDGVYGATMDEKLVEKPEIIANAGKDFDLSHAVMVGDRLNDVEGGHANKLPVIGALYGYGSPEELKETQGQIKNAADLLPLLEKWNG